MSWRCRRGSDAARPRGRTRRVRHAACVEPCRGAQPSHHYDERCFLPIHVYDSATGRPAAVVLRPGKTPSGVEVRAHLHRLVRQIRTRWPLTRITIRGDSHYARPEAMTFCEQNGLSYLFGLTGTRPLTAKVQDMADAVRTQRVVEDCEVVRGFAETKHRARSWSCERRAVARIEATRLGLDIRFVVTNLRGTSPRVVYESLYCARGQAENWIKFRKAQLASDRTSCRRAVANQIRLVLHTAAYWLMLSLREAIPAARDLARAEFATLRLRLLKIAVRSMGSLVLSTGAAIAPIPSLPMRSPRSRPRRGERNAADQHARAADQTIPADSGEYDELGQLRTDGQRDTCCCDGCRCKSKLNREMTRNREMKKLLDHGSAPAIDFIIV